MSNLNEYMVTQMSSNHSIRPTHSFHRVDASPWPVRISFTIFVIALGAVSYFHQYPLGGTLRLINSLFRVFYAALWWRDVYRESEMGHHTRRVQRGLKYGMMWFIVSESMFFVGLIWAFCNAARMPTVAIGGVWPPAGIHPIDWSGVPLTNSVLLATSYFSANIAKYAIDTGRMNRCRTQLWVTVILGMAFLFVQYLEYSHSPFTISDSVFGCNFYLVTGFHGFHVRIGVLYLIVCIFRLNDRTSQNSRSLQLSVLYWHFVDRVWIVVFGVVYVWGSYTGL